MIRDRLAAVDDDVLGADAAFQFAHLRMIPAAAEQTRRLDPKITDPLPVIVHDAVSVLLQNALVLFFDFL